MGNLTRNMSIRNKILAAVLAIVILCTSVLGVVFYRHVSDILIKNTLVQSEQTLSQTLDYLDYRLRNIMLQFNYLEINEEILAIAQKQSPTIEERRRVAKIFEENRGQNQDMVDSVFMCGKYGYMYYEYIKILLPDLIPGETDWYRLAYDNPGRVVWQSDPQNDVFVNSSGVKKLRIIKALRNSFDEIVGVLVFELKEPAVRSLLKNVELPDSGRIYLIDGEGGIISSLNGTESDRKLLKRIHEGSDYGDVVTDDLVTSYTTIKMNDWKIIYAVEKSSLTDQIQNVRIFIIYGVILCLFIVSVLAKLILTGVTRPINKLSDMIKHFEKGDFSVRFNSRYNDEIGRLGDTFDNMCENITSLIDQLTQERNLKKEAELRVLQEQIKSHFLFNTLDSIYWMSKSGDKEKTSNMIASLASMFRLSLNGGHEITTVRREIEHVSSYIYIEKIRKGEDYVFDINVDESIMDYNIPKIILQPLVENGITHGLYIKKCGVISVRGYQEGDNLVFEVEDDGGNMDTEAIESYIEREDFYAGGTKGYALANLKKRLELVYHTKDNLSFRCVPGKSSLVIIRIPKNLPKQKENDNEKI